MKPFVGDHTIETILFTIGGDFSGLHPPHLTKRIGLFLLVLAAAIMMLTGCGGGGSSSGGGKETSAKPTSQLEKISSYVKATNGFNGHNVRFAFSIDEVLAKMKAGEDLDFASFPAYNSLKENLTKAKTESSGFSDIDESTTAVLKVLDEMVPLTSKMESYYTSKDIPQTAIRKAAKWSPLI